MLGLINAISYNALKGLPMLFDGFASKRFQRVKDTIANWDEPIELIKNTFGPQTPPYKLYRELFAKKFIAIKYKFFQELKN